MQMEQGILFMKPIKKIKFNQNLEIDRTGHKIGKIHLNRLSEKLSTDELKMYFIDFEKGSKSKLHLHDSDQIIVAVKGKVLTGSRISIGTCASCNEQNESRQGTIDCIGFRYCKNIWQSKSNNPKLDNPDKFDKIR